MEPAYQRHGMAATLLGEMVGLLNKVGVEKIYTYLDWRQGDLLSLFSKAGCKRGDMANLELGA